MKIQLVSDLHLESQPQVQVQPASGADVLVLAGDIGSYQSGSALTAQGDADFGLRRFSPRHGWPTPVLYVPGNHEYDGLDFDATHERLQAVCKRLGIVWLERRTHTLGAVRFVGTTLWTDFAALGSDPSALGKAFRAANFYLNKTGSSRQGQPWLAEAVRAQALTCQDWLGQALAQQHPGPTVVVTHFAPSLRSADPRYGLVPGTAGFCNALDDWLGRAQLWLHGHLHCPSDYQAHGCRVVCNPLGYAHKGEQAAFAPERLIEVPTNGLGL